MQQLVSILIPVHNAAQSISATIQSCLNQTYPHIEIVILDDASDDSSLNVIQSFDSLKITVIQNNIRQGIAVSRNTLLDHARGAYIAWLDADDTMQEERIDSQVAFMQTHPGIDIAGSWIYTDYPDLPAKKLPLLHHHIKTILWFKNCMIQPSIISKNFYKKEQIWYDTSFDQAAEDYELWLRLINKKTFANIPLFLSTYHLTAGIELEKKQEQNKFKKQWGKLWDIKWKQIHVSVSSNDQLFFQDFIYKNRMLTTEEGNSIHKTLLLLRQNNTDSFFRLVIAFHQLRLWKNMGLGQKITHIYLLKNLVFYFRMKRNYLF